MASVEKNCFVPYIKGRPLDLSVIYEKFAIDIDSFLMDSDLLNSSSFDGDFINWEMFKRFTPIWNDCL